MFTSAGDEGLGGWPPCARYWYLWGCTLVISRKVYCNSYTVAVCNSLVYEVCVFASSLLSVSAERFIGWWDWDVKFNGEK